MSTLTLRGATGMLTNNPKHLIQLWVWLLVLPNYLLSAIDLTWGPFTDANMPDPAASNGKLNVTHLAGLKLIEDVEWFQLVGDVDWSKITGFDHPLHLLCFYFISYVSVPALTVSLWRSAHPSNAASRPLMNLKASLAAARKAWRSLFLTNLWSGTVVLALSVVVAATGWWGSVLLGRSVVVVLVAPFVSLAARSCLFAVWSLSETVAVLEGRSGRDALSRSAHLVVGATPASPAGSGTTRSMSRWITAAAALCLVAIPSAVYLLIQLSRLRAAPSAPDAGTISASLIHVGLVLTAKAAWTSSIAFIRVLATILLYLSCRARHHED